MTADEQRQLDRMEAKLDRYYGEVVSARIELAEHRGSAIAHNAPAIAAELIVAKSEAAELRAAINKLGTKLAYATGTVSVLVIMANWIVPWLIQKL